MATLRKAVPQKIKYNLIKEAGYKCANPGCANFRAHIHHIKRWAVYQLNDENSMIAVCPSCHDEIHNGILGIDDETLLRWKNIKRPNQPSDHLYVEPSDSLKLLLGTIAVTGTSGLSVFEFTSNNKLSFNILDNDIFLLNLQISSVSGDELIKIKQNHIKYKIGEPLEFNRRPGKISITAPLNPEYIPFWAFFKMWKQEPNFDVNSRLTLLELEVVEPGLVQVQGIWAESSRVIIITKKSLNFLTPFLERPISLCGDGKESVLYYKGPINTSLFGIV